MKGATIPMYRRLLVLLLSLLLLATGCAKGTSSSAPDKTEKSNPAVQPVLAVPVSAVPTSLPAPIRARILAVGDLLMHLPLVTTSQTGPNEYDFTPLFAPVRKWIAGADLALCNLETTLTGNERFPYAGYPAFNTPPVFARDIKAVGFDAVTHANNHSLDYDEYGLIKTIEALEAVGLPRTGTARTQEERDRILVVQVAPDIQMAVLSYSYGTNGIPLPKPFSVNLLDKAQMRQDVRRARETPGVDLVAVALHMGDEYARQPNAEQEEYIRLLTEAGADIILGNHPHVIQKIITRDVVDVFARDRKRAIIYSLGNFISNQIGLPREAGLMLLIDVVKEGGITRVEQVSFVPTWVHPYTVDGLRKYRVVAVEQALRDYEAKADPLITAEDYEKLKAVLADTLSQAIGGPEIKLWGIDQPVNPFRR